MVEEKKDPFPKICVFDNGVVGWKMNGRLYLAGQSWKAKAFKNLKQKGKL